MRTRDIILDIIKNNSPELAVEKIMDRFKLPKTVKDLLYDYAPGTKVKIVANTSNHEFKIGDVVEIKFKTGDDTFVAKGEYGSRWWVTSSEFEIIK